MAEGRMIKKRISRSKKLARLKSDTAKVLYFMIYPHADVKGRMEADAEIIKGMCIPYFNWDIKKIHKNLKLLHDIGLIILYNVNNEQCLQITRFADFQTLKEDREAKSTIPAPNSGVTQEDSGVNQENSPLSLSKVKDNIEQDFNLLWEFCPRREGKKAAFRHYQAALKQGATHECILKAIQNYAQKMKDEKTEDKYIKAGSALLNNWKDYENYIRKPRSRTDY